MPLDPPREATLLGEQLTRPGPSLVFLSGLRGVGKTHLLADIARDDPSAVYYRALPLPDADHRRLLSAELWTWSGGELDVAGRDWDGIWTDLAEEVTRTRRRLVLLLDDSPELVGSRSRLPELLAGGWSAVRARSLPVHLVLAGRSPELAMSWGGADGPLAEWRTSEVPMAPRDFREVGDLVAGYAPRDRLLAWAVFGGSPHRLRHLDARVTLATNVQRLVLDPGGALADDGIEHLAAGVSSPSRYAGILRTMAGGAAEWGEIAAGTAGVESGGQMAPYLSRLEELGLVAAERSLDAGPRSRRRRYRLTDPFLAFWYHLVLPHVSAVRAGRGGEVWTRHVRPGLDGHAARQLPALARQYLARYGGERLPSAGREVGGLWGKGYDLPVAGTLRTGPVVYGTTHWLDEPVDIASDEAVAEQLRATRYGFGREARIRLLVSPSGFTPGLLRRAARDRLLHLVGAEALVGA